MILVSIISCIFVLVFEKQCELAAFLLEDLEDLLGVLVSDTGHLGGFSDLNFLAINKVDKLLSLLVGSPHIHSLNRLLVLSILGFLLFFLNLLG